MSIQVELGLNGARSCAMLCSQVFPMKLGDWKVSGSSALSINSPTWESHWVAETRGKVYSLPWFLLALCREGNTSLAAFGESEWSYFSPCCRIVLYPFTTHFPLQCPDLGSTCLLLWAWGVQGTIPGVIWFLLPSPQGTVIRHNLTQCCPPKRRVGLGPNQR